MCLTLKAAISRCMGRLWRDRNFVRLTRNGTTLLGSNTLASVLELAQVVVLTRLLVPARYGELSLVLAAVNLVNQFLDVRVREMTVKFGAEFFSKGDHRLAALLKLSYLIDVVIGVLSFLVVTAIAPWVANHILHKPELTSLIELYSLTLIVATLKGTNNSILLVLDKFRWISSYGVAMPAIELVLVGAAAFFFGQVHAVLLALVFMELVRLGVSTVLATKALVAHYRLRDILLARLSLLKALRPEITRMLIHTNFMAYFRMVNTKVDVMILGAFRPSAEVALYKLARALATVVVRFSDPFFSAILPDLSRLYADGRINEYKALLKRCMGSMSLIMFCSAMAVTLFSNFAVNIVSGKAYSDAGPLLAVGIWGFAIGGAFFWTWPAAVSIGRADFGTKVGVVVVAVQLSLALTLVPRYGAMGNIIALVAAYVVGQPLLALLVSREVSRKVDLRNVNLPSNTAGLEPVVSISRDN